MPTQVSLVKASGYDYHIVYNALIDTVNLLGGMKKFVNPGDLVLIKPNLLSPNSPEKAVTTHPIFVKAVIQMVKKAGGKPVVGDSPGVSSLGKVAKKTGIKKVCDEMEVKLVEFSPSLTVKGGDDAIFQQIEIAKIALEADKVINLPKLKTHGQMLLTLGVKNLFGCIEGRRKAFWHLSAGIDRKSFATMLVEIYRKVNPILTILDGIVGMEGDGPGNGIPRDVGLIIGSNDAVALDVVTCEILGVKKEKLLTNVVAQQMGVGESDIEKINILGEKIEDLKMDNFKLPPISGLEMFPKFIYSFLKNACTTRPKINKKTCNLCQSCKDKCPPGIIAWNKDGPSIDNLNCIQCFCCQEICPNGAVEIKSGWALKFLKLIFKI
jgi:uncharacterized protein (DUF362 family)/Pyruvate/2-oxoacid:ferredoxin oxidoreductase delta subunit